MKKAAKKRAPPKKGVKKAPKPKVARTRNAGTMTEAMFFSKLRSALRSAFRWWTPMKMALEAASRPYKGTNKRQKKEYQCAHCHKWFKRTEVEIDHIEAAGSLRCYEDIVPFIQRLTVEDVTGYQILCKKDHKTKTLADNKARKTTT